MCLRCLGRNPSSAERRVLLNLFTAQRETLLQDSAGCRAILAIEGQATDDALADRAAWVLVARVVLNLDEFFTRE